MRIATKRLFCADNRITTNSNKTMFSDCLFVLEKKLVFAPNLSSLLLLTTCEADACKFATSAVVSLRCGGSAGMLTCLFFGSYGLGSVMTVRSRFEATSFKMS